MNFFDFIIIYLACGAPLGVYYYLQNRNKPDNKFFYLKIIFNFLFWVPVFIKTMTRIELIRNLFDSAFDQKVVSDAKLEKEIFELKKIFEKNANSNFNEVSIFVIREIFDRYVGLTLEIQPDSGKPTDFEENFYNETSGKNKISERCLHRRNLKRLILHQNLARIDFIKLLKIIEDKSPDKSYVFENGLALASFLNDPIAVDELKVMQKFYATREQNNHAQTENDLWPLQNLNSVNIKNTSGQISHLSAPSRFSVKD